MCVVTRFVHDVCLSLTTLLPQKQTWSVVNGEIMYMMVMCSLRSLFRQRLYININIEG